jgi:two-component system, NarL family, sensor histidine kinase UhpB
VSKDSIGHLIIVDDEVETMMPACEFLSHCGYAVSVFTSGKEALAEISKRPSDLLMTDLIMPEIDGITLLRAALRIDPHLIGIIVTGQGTVETAVEAMKVGAFDYILKPPELKLLKQIVSRAMSVRRLLETESKYRSIFENAVGGIYQTSPEGRCITANRAFARILGYPSPGELIQTLEDIGRLYVKSGRRAEFIHLMQRDGIVTGFESEVYRKDGSAIWVSENALSVHNTNGDLICYEGIIEDITMRKQTEEELKTSREQLRNLLAYLESAREKERMYIAREIHDELGQTLTALKMDLFWMHKRLPGEQKALTEKTVSMLKLIDSAATTVRRISGELRPGLLDDLGLTAAIEWQIGEFQRRTGIQCEVVLDPEEIIIGQDISTALYRIFQEALTNIARHSHAKTAEIFLEMKQHEIRLSIKDNGRGISPNKIGSTKSFGLIGIRERVRLLQGEVEITGANNKGTTVRVTIPLMRR